MSKFKKWKNISISIIFTLLAFIASNYWSYTSGRDSGRSLLIDTLAKYRAFYDEVQKEHKIACGQDGKLRGLYLSQFNSMLPVIEDKIQPPYDNPCPSLFPPAAPTGFKISACMTWETWEEFLKDPEPSMAFSFPEGVLIYPIGDKWRDAIINWHEKKVAAKKKAIKQNPEGKTRMKIKAKVIENGK